MLEIKELQKENFPLFINLLLERGEAPEDYYYWKYFKQPMNNFPTGFIAYFDGIPLGCIGVINKIYIDQFNEKQCATWFADWFVSSQARGKGIGLALMKKVYDLSSYAFGIPGPQKAQIIAQKAGYKIQNHFYEVILPCNPFLYGLRKYNSGFLINTLRGLRNLKNSGLVFGKKNVEIFKIQNFDDLLHVETLKKNSFYQTREFIDWLIKMPLNDNNRRTIYKVEYKCEWIILFVENDSNKNKRARVILNSDMSSLDKLNFLKKTRKALAKIGVLYLQTYLFSDKKLELDSTYIKPIPQVSASPLTNFNVSLIDMESRWRDFELN